VQDPATADKLEAKAAELINEALITNGFGDHYLQDSYASGHMINKTQIMQWFVQWLDKHDWKADFASDESWKRVQAIAYRQPGSPTRRSTTRPRSRARTPARTTNRARNPQAVEDIGGDWKARFDALGLQVPPSLAAAGTDTRTIVEWWQAEAAEDSRLEQSRRPPERAAVRAEERADRRARRPDQGLRDHADRHSAAYTGRKLMSGRFELRGPALDNLLMMTFKLRKEYVPRDMARFRTAQQQTAAGDDREYQKMAAAVTHQDFFEFLNHKYLQKSTNALHDKFCRKGLDVQTGAGQQAFRVYGDDKMFKSNSADVSSTRARPRTCHATRSSASSTARLRPVDVGHPQPPAQQGAAVRRACVRRPRGVAQPRRRRPTAQLLRDEVFPGMGGKDKFVGFTGPVQRSQHVHQQGLRAAARAEAF